MVFKDHWGSFKLIGQTLEAGGSQLIWDLNAELKLSLGL